MLVIAGMVGFLSTLSGVVISSLAVQVPTGPVVVLVATAFLILSVFGAPCRGILWRRQAVSDLSSGFLTKMEAGIAAPTRMEQNP